MMKFIYSVILLVVIMASYFIYQKEQNDLRLTSIAFDVLLNNQSIEEHQAGSEIKTIAVNSNKRWNERVIAHAGGRFNGIDYTNSEEALENAINKGFKYIELDLLVTSDDKIVAAHDWLHLSTMLGMETPSNVSLSSTEIKGRKYKGDLTILFVESIKPHFSSHKNTVLITDKIENLPLLLGSGINPDDVIVEVFSIEKYQQALTLGFTNLALNISLNKLYLLEWLQLNHIQAVTYALPKSKSEIILATNITDAGITSLVFTTNDPNVIQAETGKVASMFYVDDLELPIFE